MLITTEAWRKVHWGSLYDSPYFCIVLDNFHCKDKKSILDCLTNLAFHWHVIFHLFVILSMLVDSKPRFYHNPLLLQAQPSTAHAELRTVSLFYVHSNINISTFLTPLTSFIMLSLGNVQANIHSHFRRRETWNRKVFVESSGCCGAYWVGILQSKTSPLQTWNGQWAPCGNAVSGGRPHT